MREHFFYVAVARFVFQHPEHGVVSVRDPIRLTDAERHGLSPLLIYGLSVAGLPIRWMTFSTLSEPKAIQAVLQEAWSQAEGLRGPPDALRINRHVASACPDLASNLARIGVRLTITDTTDKVHPAALRSAQDAARWLRDAGTEGLADHDPILAFCQDAARDHRYDTEGGPQATASREMRQRIEQWLALPVRKAGSLPIDSMDWTPGPWLSPQQASVPPEHPRYLHSDGFGGRVWLLDGREHAADRIEADNVSSDYSLDEVAELARNLVACWPNAPAEIAAEVGITLRQLQWFMTGRADLDHGARHRFEALLGIGIEEHSGYFTAFGPYVLIARKPQALEAVYTEISHGGDANPWELVPSTGESDPSWRYILINTCGAPPSIVMVPRGDRIADRLDDLILNFAGSLPVDRSLYQEVLSTCARACQTPSSNIAFMKEFAQRYEQQWIDCTWRPE